MAHDRHTNDAARIRAADLFSRDRPEFYTTNVKLGDRQMKYMKGVNYMPILKAVIMILIVFAVALAFWNKLKDEASVAGPRALDGVLVGVLLYSLMNSAKKKGIVVTTSLLTIVVFVVIVTFFLIMIYLSLTTEAGSTSSSFFYGIFDAVLRNLPWVK